MVTSTALSGENHLNSTPRCTTAGISLKSKGVVTCINEFRNYLLLCNKLAVLEKCKQKNRNTLFENKQADA
jgi:hypothetical protein